MTHFPRKNTAYFLLVFIVISFTNCIKDPIYIPLDTSLTNRLYEGSGCNSFKRILYSRSSASGQSVKALNDGGYIVTGTIGGWSDKSVAFLARTTCEGEMTWYQTYSDFYAVEALEVLVTEDNGFLIMTTSATNEAKGYDRDISSYVVLIRTDSVGNVIWKSGFPLRWYQANSLFLDNCPDGGYILAGVEFSGTKLTLVKTDKNGKEIWRNYLPQLRSLLHCSVNQDGNIILGGYDRGDKAVLISANPSGNELWTKVIKDTTTKTALYTITETSAGDMFVIYSVVRSQPSQSKINHYYIRMINANGDSIWEKPYKYSIGKIEHSSGSGIILSRGNCLIRLNIYGDSIWENCYGNDRYSGFYEVQESTGGGFVATGKYENSVWLMKVDENGN